MSIQITEKDRTQYTAGYILSLEEAYRKWRKSRWILLACMAFLIFKAIWHMVISTAEFTWFILMMFSLIGFSVVTIGIILKWNLPQKKYEKAKAIREILDVEEAETTKKNTRQDEN